ncbi:MAG: ATP-binding protein [Dehalococcoidia bacterium]|nr:ATP-binding protein [Dehalococcoidia bacterium]MDW8119287.1 ATP-binding protein [Chloroflexota bacterium]
MIGRPHLPEHAGRYLGQVIGGSLAEGLAVKLDPAVSPEEVKAGILATVVGETHRFVGVVTNIELKASDPSLPLLVDKGSSLLAQAARGSVAYAVLTLRPSVTLPLVGTSSSTVQPARSIPGHFAPVHLATPADVAAIYGTEDDQHFWVGNPLDLDAKVCLNLPLFVMRSNGIFGKTGSGKSFLARILLAGILQTGTAGILVFDMHNDYGWQARSEEGHTVKGLKQLFPSKVALFTLDEEWTRRRGVTPDHVVHIPRTALEPEDIALLQATLNLTDVQVETVFALRDHLGQGWLDTFCARRAHAEAWKALREAIAASASTMDALWRHLRPIQRYPFLTDKDEEVSSVQTILHTLARGMTVVLEFGRYRDDLTAYVLVANYLTRRIHERYVQQSEEAQTDQAKKPKPLLIVIEEAHKFLAPSVARLTTFGTIAREMRKYYVTLLVIDQRPSQIDPEVRSQLGTRIVCKLDDEQDLDAVVERTPGGRELKAVLASMEAKQQALIFGEAVPVPVLVRVRPYGPAFYEAVASRALSAQDGDALFG